MISSDSIETMQRVFKLEYAESIAIAEQMPIFMAHKIADKFVEANWPTLQKDKELMRQVRDLVVEQSVAAIASMVEKQVAEALGIEAEKPTPPAS